MNKPASFIREKEGVYWVLAEYESSSSPGTMYEVRTSQRDGKTYCTCKGWVCALNRLKKTGGKGEAVCKHIKQYRMEEPEVAKTMVIMDFESFVTVRRGIAISNKGIASDNVQPRRA